MKPYNGYSGAERLAKFAIYKQLLVSGRLARPKPPCQLCSDRDCAVVTHSEDYSRPYRWRPPAAFVICRRCHLALHMRFALPLRWAAFKWHVRQGGYARNFSLGRVPTKLARKELRALTQARIDGQRWWEKLTLNKRALTAPWARPRP